jgi:hypothetical protein
MSDFWWPLLLQQVLQPARGSEANIETLRGGRLCQQ